MAQNRSNILLGHLKLFTIIGYCTFTIGNCGETNKNKERCLFIWSCVLLVCFNIIAFGAIFSRDEFLYQGDAFGCFNDIMKIVFADIAITCSYLESIFKANSLKKFWKLYYRLQENSSPATKKFFNFKESWQNDRFLLIFYVTVAFEFVVMFVFIVYQSKNRHLILFWSIFSPLAYAVYMRNMQFIFYIELIRMELVKLQSDLNLMVEYSKFTANSCSYNVFEDFLRRKLADKQKLYQMIYEMFEHFQSSFGLSIVAVLLMIYVRVLVDAYFAYYSYYNNWNEFEIFLILPSLLEMPAFLITSKNCMDVALANGRWQSAVLSCCPQQVKLITFNLHSIITQFNDSNLLISSQIKLITFNLHNVISQFNTRNQTGIISIQLQNFSLQILHQRICINGIGISRMDGYMLTRAIGSVTTYMIFFIQFMPKFSYIQEDKKHE